MKYVIYSVAILVLIALMQGVFRFLPFRGAIPDLLLLFVIVLALTGKPSQLLFVAVSAGFFADLSSGVLPGSFIIGYAIIALCVYVISHNWVALQDSWWYLPLIVLASIFVLSVWLVLFSSVGLLISQYVLFSPQVLIHRFIPSLIYDLILLYPMYILTSWLVRRLSRLDASRRFGF